MLAPKGPTAFIWVGSGIRLARNKKDVAFTSTQQLLSLMSKIARTVQKAVVGGCWYVALCSPFCIWMFAVFMYHVVGPWIFSIGLPHLEPDDHVPSTQISPEALGNGDEC